MQRGHIRQDQDRSGHSTAPHTAGGPHPGRDRRRPRRLIAVAVAAAAAFTAAWVLWPAGPGATEATGAAALSTLPPPAPAPVPAPAPAAQRRPVPPAFRDLLEGGTDAAPPAPQPPPRWQTYVVSPGDTLGAIAQRFGVQVWTLEAANDLNQKSLLAVGKELIIPTVDGVLHRVRSGDTLWDIAHLHDADPDLVVEANPDIEPGALPLGYTVLVPGGRPAVRTNQLASRTAGGSRARQTPAPPAGGSASAAAPAGDPGDGGGTPGRLFEWPLRGRITSGFGRRTHPVYGTRSFHEGIDIAAPKGTPIVAAAAGVVTRSSRYGGYGLTVEVDHGNGIVTRYSHNSKLLVGVGDRVETGQVIARVGSTGVSTGAHLDFGVYQNGRPLDPMEWLP